jgi:hypothetical protein
VNNLSAKSFLLHAFSSERDWNGFSSLIHVKRLPPPPFPPPSTCTVSYTNICRDPTCTSRNIESLQQTNKIKVLRAVSVLSDYLELYMGGDNLSVNHGSAAKVWYLNMRILSSSCASATLLSFQFCHHTDLTDITHLELLKLAVFALVLNRLGFPLQQPCRGICFSADTLTARERLPRRRQKPVRRRQ